ncbi:MAG: hypothetical protein DRQ44_13485 [Gammaproteobacteria bacterium]|nr:MAG: hypothetical protein DRQ44_13485 [Gammaproteobacteria bacterium]
MKTGVTGYYFPGISCCRVAIKYAIYVFTNTDEFFLKISSITVFITEDTQITIEIFLSAKHAKHAKHANFLKHKKLLFASFALFAD